MPFTIVREDITRLPVDAIVNAANTALAMGGGVCGAIFNAAGSAALQASCEKLAPIRTGEAVITPGFALPCKYIIHTAGPVYDAAHPAESERLLRACYRNSMQLALENGCESLAFPLISSGIYGYPKPEALQVACTEIRTFVAEQELNVTLVVFEKPEFMLSAALLGHVKSYIDEHYVAQQTRRRSLLEVEYDALYRTAGVEPPRKALERPTAPEADKTPEPWAASLPAAPDPQPAKRKTRLPKLTEFFSSSAPTAPSAPTQISAPPPRGLDEWIGNLDEPFSAALFRLIDAKGLKDTEVYKRANLDRKLFSKIRTGKGYTPGKRTVLALCIALGLTLDETEDLLRRAGYALSPCQKSDVIVMYFITNHRYNIDELNEVLFHFDQATLGC